MSPDVALLSEVWDLVKNFVHIKERFDVCDGMLKAFEEHSDISDIEMYKNEFDRIMKAAIVAHFSDDLLDEDDDD